MAFPAKGAKPFRFLASYSTHQETMSCYVPLGTMIWVVLCVLQVMFYMACGCVVEERIALMRIRSSLVEANSSEVLGSWGRSDDCCSWERVTCNNSTRVSGLNLDLIALQQNHGTYEIRDPCWNLNLTIFSSFHELQLLDLSLNYACPQNFDGLQGLTKLQYLNLSYNNFIGNNILESLGTLPSLEVIDIDLSNLGGTLQYTAFRTLRNLRELHLGSNQLNGSIPDFFFELPHLEYLDLSGNQLEGSIPAYLLELPRLKYLDLSENMLNGSIPDSLFDLPRIEYLDLSRNPLQGRLPISTSLNFSSSLQTLKLSDNNLKGKFDFFWLRNCPMLKKVDLSWNADLAVDVKFHMRVPPFQLKALMISGCNLDNSIIAGPNFLGTQRHLEILDLSNNNLTGSTPNWIIANKVTLLYLNLANNSLVGSLDLMWQHQFNLEIINISTNSFVGQLPKNINSVFPNLKVLDASNNIIFGDLPPLLCKINNLFVMDLSNNKLTGEVPVCLFTNTSLGVLKLSNNNLGGQILGGASNLSFTAALYLANNNFEGSLPNNLTGNLEFLDLHDNKLSGKLDVSSWNLSWLQVLSVASNSLTGEICPAICKLTSLQYLDMSDNNFEGSIPHCDNKLTLKFLNMSSNTLSGFRGDFLNSSCISALDLRYNQFSGSLDWIDRLSRVKMLLLGRNRFEGQISSNLCRLLHLTVIDFSHNKLLGSLPPCIGGMSFRYHIDDLYIWSSAFNSDFSVSLSDMDMSDMWWMDYRVQYGLQDFTFSTKGNLYTYDPSFFNLMFGIDLSMNMLSGEIPWEIGNLSHLKSLNLSHNHFIGPIPATLANMSAIESLDLSNNELSGPIPWQLTRMWSLEIFSVAYNNLSGCIPISGQFGSFSIESFLGNTNLYNLSQGNWCSPDAGQIGEEDDASQIGEEDVHRASADPILYGISATSFVMAFWVTIAFTFCHPFGQHVVLASTTL